MAEGQLYLNVNVDKAAALRRGQIRAGHIWCELTPEMLAVLTAEEREELSRYVCPDPTPHFHQRLLATSGLEPADIQEALAAAIDKRRKVAAEAARKAEEEEAKRRERDAEQVEWIKQASLDELIETGSAVDFEPATTCYRRLEHFAEAGRLEEVQAECEQRNKQAAERRAQAKREREERLEREEIERKAWSERHGSPRLRRLLAENIEHTAVYLDERLAMERPEWRWDKKVMGSADKPRNVPQEGLDLLDAARASVPEKDRAEVELVYWTISSCNDEDHYETDGKCPGYHEGWRGYAATATFLGKDVVYGGPDDE